MTPVEYLLNDRTLGTGVAYNAADWVADAPVADNTPGAAFTTKLTLRPKALSGKVGNLTFHYDKADFSKLGTIRLHGPLSTADILAFLSAVYGTDVLASDFTPSLPDMVTPGLNTATANAVSVLFKGTLTIDLF